MTGYFRLFVFSLICMYLFGCEPIDPVIPNEEELITTLELRLVSSDQQDTILFSFKDLDGDGGLSPVIQNEKLKVHTSYNGMLTLRNDAINPPSDISMEVEEEGNAHQFFYVVKNAGITIQYADKDANGNPIGLKTSITTGNESNGELTIILRHNPDKFGSSVSDGLIDQAGGETDIEVTFKVDVI